MEKEITGVIAEVVDHGKNWVINFEGKSEGVSEGFSLILEKSTLNTLFTKHGTEINIVEGFTGDLGTPVLTWSKGKKLDILVTPKDVRLTSRGVPILETKCLDRVPIKLVIK